MKKQQKKIQLDEHTDIGAALDDTNSCETVSGTPFRSINNAGPKTKYVDVGVNKALSPRPSFEGGTKMPPRLLESRLKSDFPSNLSVSDSCCDSMSEYSEIPEHTKVATRRSKQKSQFFNSNTGVSDEKYNRRSTLKRRSKSFCRHHLKGEDEDSEEYEARIAKRVQEKQQSKKLKQISKLRTPSTLKRTKVAKKIVRKESVVNRMVSRKSLSGKEKLLKRKMKVRKFLDHYWTMGFMTALTVYALFFDDIRILAFPKQADDAFFGITLVGIILFTIEVCLGAYALPGYVGSFFFYLDIISTLTMIPDCGWIWNQIIEGGSEGSAATDLAKTTRAARVVRVIRIFRLIRLLRIAKLYKQTKLAQKKAEHMRFMSNKKAAFGNLAIKSPEDIEKEQAFNNEQLEQ